MLNVQMSKICWFYLLFNESKEPELFSDSWIECLVVVLTSLFCGVILLSIELVRLTGNWTPPILLALLVYAVSNFSSLMYFSCIDIRCFTYIFQCLPQFWHTAILLCFVTSFWFFLPNTFPSNIGIVKKSHIKSSNHQPINSQYAQPLLLFFNVLSETTCTLTFSLPHLGHFIYLTLTFT